MHWLIVDVTKLAGTPGSETKVVRSGTIEGLSTPLGWVEDGEPVEVRLDLRATKEGIRIAGKARGRLHLRCSRCLVGYERDFERDVEETYYFDPVLAEGWDGYEVQDQVVDLEPMLRDAIVLDIPPTPVHDEQCRGLCPVCGTDLNYSACGHNAETTDVRWAPLEQLKVLQAGNQDEEVER